jgi:hypothetical protein
VLQISQSVTVAQTGVCTLERARFVITNIVSIAVGIVEAVARTRKEAALGAYCATENGTGDANALAVWAVIARRVRLPVHRQSPGAVRASLRGIDSNYFDCSCLRHHAIPSPHWYEIWGVLRSVVGSRLVPLAMESLR